MLPLLLFMADGAATDWLKAPPKEWLMPHTVKHGFDITRDGSVWINVDPPQTGEDYAILANDLYRASGRWRTVWVRGYFKYAPKVPYRESKLQVAVDCQDRNYSVLYSIYYRADGTIYDSQRGNALLREPAIPGTYGEVWVDTICDAERLTRK